jgi:hypothetical protein
MQWSLLILATQAAAGGRLSVFLNQNGIERKITWQCEDLEECIERLQSRIESKGECDLRVNKIVLERIHIPGLDDA